MPTVRERLRKLSIRLYPFACVSPFRVCNIIEMLMLTRADKDLDNFFISNMMEARRLEGAKDNYQFQSDKWPDVNAITEDDSNQQILEKITELEQDLPEFLKYYYKYQHLF